MTTSFRENYRSSYNVDLVFCIDTTGSMRDLINMVKRNALSLYDDIQRELREHHKNIDRMRVRVVAFKDYLADGDRAISISDFFEMPAEAPGLEECVTGLEADGGGDTPEDGLEALAYAMRSPWNSEGLKKRHIIIVWSDAPTHPIGFGRGAANYPPNMPATFSDLSAWWGYENVPGIMDEHAKRLILFTPNAPEWDHIKRDWNAVILQPQALDAGLTDLQYEEVISCIVGSI